VNHSPLEIWLYENKKINQTIDLCKTTVKHTNLSFDYQANQKYVFDLSSMIVGNSVIEMYKYILTCLSEQNKFRKKVLVHVPNYDALWLVPQNLGYEVLLFSDFDKINCDENTLAVVISNPNNPTGILYNADNLLKIAQNNGAYLIVDAIFAPIPFELLMGRTPEKIEKNKIIISSLKKCFNISEAAYAQSTDDFILKKKNLIDIKVFKKNVSLINKIQKSDFDYLHQNKMIAEKIFNVDLSSTNLWFSLFKENQISSHGVPSKFFEDKDNNFRVSWADKNFNSIVNIFSNNQIF